MDVFVVFGSEKILGLPCRDVESKPSFILRMDDGIIFDAGGNQPIAHSLN
jgi:hypothetical protein